jgi:hypothetical protein
MHTDILFRLKSAFRQKGENYYVLNRNIQDKGFRA